MAPVASNSAIKPDIARINSGMDRLPKRIDAILVTHGHFDHLLDVPEIARRTGASVIAAPTSCYLSQAVGLPATKTRPVWAGDSLHIGAATVHVFPTVHDRIFGVMPFPGVRAAVPLSPPQRPSDWVCGEPLAFLIELDAKRIYVDAGGTLAALPPTTDGPVDLAILGVYLPESRKGFCLRFADFSRVTFFPAIRMIFPPLNRGLSIRSDDQIQRVARRSREIPSCLTPAGPPDPARLLYAMDTEVIGLRKAFKIRRVICSPDKTSA